MKLIFLSSKAKTFNSSKSFSDLSRNNNFNKENSFCQYFRKITKRLNNKDDTY